MDNSRRSLQDYFNAVRREPGLSEDAVREIVGQGLPRESRKRRAILFGALFLPLLIGAAVMMRTPWNSTADTGPAITAREGSSAAGRSTGIGASTQASLSGSNGVPGTTPESGVETEQTEYQIHTTNDQKVDAMMKPGTTTGRMLAMTVAMMGAATAALPAQTTDHLRRDGDTPAVVQEMQAELGAALSDYWTSRLNDYKVRIDRTLAPADLDELNKLRVRFNVLAMEWLGSEMTRKDLTQEERKEKLNVLVGIYKSAKDMAGRYRAGLDPLGQTVVGDLADFLPEMNQRADDFVAMRRAEIDGAGYANALTKARGKTQEVATLLSSSQGRMGVQMLYTMTLEPVVMLYNGTDLNTLWQQVEQLSGGNRTLSLPTDAIAGYKLPDARVLQPSTPNPASSTVSIPYSLAEASGQTLLRIYDAQGTLVGTYDEGAKADGDYTVQVNVSGLAPGTYLYHLTTRTPKGDRVYSRTMQVVR